MNTRIFRLNRKNKEAGFTLLELLLVVAGIAILATLIFVVLRPGETLNQFRDSKRASDVQAIMAAMQMYAFDNNGDVPDKTSTGWGANNTPVEICTGTSGDLPTRNGGSGSDLTTCALGFIDLLTNAKYLTKIPTDPGTGSTAIPNGDTKYTAEIDATGLVTITATDSAGDPITAIGKFTHP